MNSLLGFIQLGKWELGKPTAAASGGAVTKSVSDALSFSDSVTLNLLQTSDILTLSDSTSYTLAVAGLNFNLVQSAQSARNATSLTFPNPVAAGDLLIVALGVSTTLGNPPTISDSLGSQWTQGVYQNANFGAQYVSISILYAVAATSGADTITVSDAAFGSSDSQLIIAELSGNITDEINVTGSTPYVTPILVTTQPSDVAISVCFGYGGQTPVVTPPEVLIQAVPYIGYRFELGLSVADVAAAGIFQSSLNAGNTWAGVGVLYATVAFLSTLSVKSSDTLVLSDSAAAATTTTVYGVSESVSDTLALSDSLALLGGASNYIAFSDTLSFLDFAAYTITVPLPGSPISCLTGSSTSGGSVIPNFVF